MTWLQLMAQIAQMSIDEITLPAEVWPPADCPAASTVPMTGIVKTPDGKPVISTGKAPE